MFIESSLHPFTLFANTTSPTVFTYFSQSDVAGQIICTALLLLSFIAWTLIIGKYMELNHLRNLNRLFEKKLISSTALEEIEGSLNRSQTGPYAQLFIEALEVSYNVDSYIQDSANTTRRMNYIENGLQRSIASQVERYESKLVVLGSIVSGAPFIGLLGTVWGIMDAFGSVAMLNTVTLHTLAPGVSGALLTTIAGLMVAIPSLFGYNYLLTKTRVMIRELENFASTLADRMELELESTLQKITNSIPS
jgi:biopolymer transport protein TolQ